MNTSDFLNTRPQPSGKPNLKAMTQLQTLLDHPEKAFPVIHLAGTNGKGSTANYLYHILLAAGYRVGLFTSPHIFDYKETIKIKGQEIRQENFEAAGRKIQAVYPQSLSPSPFECLTTLAFLAFREAQLDLVIIEAGLGGTRDATNVLENKIATGFTSIAMDHMAFLGNSLEEITQEKAGIMRSKVPVFIGINKKDISQQLEEAGKKLACPIYYAAKQKELASQYTLPLAGAFQKDNLALALAILNHLPYPLPPKAIQDGLNQVQWPCRLESIQAHQRQFLLDGGHNLAAAKQLKDYINSYPVQGRKILLLGLLADKDYQAIIPLLSSAFDQVLVTQPASPRALPLKDYPGSSPGFSQWQDALEKAITHSTKKDLLVVAGSFYLTFPVRKKLLSQ